MTPQRYLMYISQNYSYAILRPIQDKIMKRGGEVAWFLEGSEVSHQHIKNSEVKLADIEQVVAWKPDVVLVPGNVVPSFIPGVKVGVFHGFDVGKLNRRGNEDHYNIRHCFDLYCTQGPSTTKKFKKLAKLDNTFSVAETGWSTLDPLFLDTKDNLFIDKNDQRKTVLLCSTFSRNLSCAAIVFETVKRLSETGEWRWLVQFHPKMDKSVVELYKSIQGEHLQFVETDNVLPLLQAADVMLCDTSSVLIMHILQRKPVVAFNNKTNNDCLIHINKVEDIYSAIQCALTEPVDLMERIDEYCNAIHPYRDGESSNRVLEAVERFKRNKFNGLKAKPWNIIRQLKLRKKLNYWGW